MNLETAVQTITTCPEEIPLGDNGRNEKQGLQEFQCMTQWVIRSKYVTLCFYLVLLDWLRGMFVVLVVVNCFYWMKRSCAERRIHGHSHGMPAWTPHACLLTGQPP